MKDNKDLTQRKGAVKAAHIPPTVMDALNRGSIPSVNLTEWLAVDHRQLLMHVFADKPLYLKPLQDNMASLHQKSVRSTIMAIGEFLLQESKNSSDQQLLPFLSAHVSDSVRCWACYMIGTDPELSILQKLHAIQPFAADAHFGVREIAWMAVRNEVSLHLNESIPLLSKWVSHPDENIRRFAVEVTRPCGDWYKQNDQLNTTPAIALPILEPLKADTAVYVQNSVGNWLNDAGKSQPQWVKQLCEQWAVAANSATTKIIKRASRNI